MVGLLLQNQAEVRFAKKSYFKNVFLLKVIGCTASYRPFLSKESPTAIRDT